MLQKSYVQESREYIIFFIQRGYGYNRLSVDANGKLKPNQNDIVHASSKEKSLFLHSTKILHRSYKLVKSHSYSRKVFLNKTIVAYI